MDAPHTIFSDTDFSDSTGGQKVKKKEEKTHAHTQVLALVVVHKEVSLQVSIEYCTAYGYQCR